MGIAFADTTPRSPRRHGPDGVIEVLADDPRLTSASLALLPPALPTSLISPLCASKFTLNLSIRSLGFRTPESRIVVQAAEQ